MYTLLTSKFKTYLLKLYESKNYLYLSKIILSMTILSIACSKHIVPSLKHFIKQYKPTCSYTHTLERKEIHMDLH